MNATTRQRLFDVSAAFDHPVTRLIIGGLLALVLLMPPAFLLLSATGKVSPVLRKDLWDRYKSWLLFIPMMFGPVLLGAAWVIAGVCILGLACYREFARATGLFRESIISGTVILGILALTFAALDHWYGLFVAITPLIIAIMATASILTDRPKGYIQRVALGIFGYMLMGVCFGHLAYMANDSNYRAILLWLISAVGLNDIFAYVCGKSFGRRKIAPNTSPNKTLGGALGALVLTTTYAALVGHWVFRNTHIDYPIHLITLGLIISAAGQLGDLTLSSIKRDLGIKDWASTFPGHGGLLDRFNSLIFTAPAVFHYVTYLQNIGWDQPKRIFASAL